MSSCAELASCCNDMAESRLPFHFCTAWSRLVRSVLRVCTSSRAACSGLFWEACVRRGRDGKEGSEKGFELHLWWCSWCVMGLQILPNPSAMGMHVPLKRLNGGSMQGRAWYAGVTVMHEMCSDPKGAKDVHYPILILVPYNLQVQIPSIKHTQHKNKPEER